jgi:hypothetical protein
MCFVASKIIFRVAKRDKIYYKVLQVKNGKYYPPYRGIHSVYLNEVTDPYFLDQIDIHVNNRYYPFSQIEIGSGFIHLYRTHFYAKIRCKTCQSNNSDENYVVVKAIVPKGSLYAKNETEVIADCVIYKKI